MDREFDDISNPEGNRLVKKDDIAYNMMRMWQGAVGVAPVDCMISPAYVVLAPNSDVFSQFYYKMFKLKKYLYLLTSYSQGLTSDRLRLYYKEFAQMNLPHPVIEEQQQIASFLSDIDTKIEKLSRKKELLKQYKKGVMQKIFSREIRFKDENGEDFPEWEENVFRAVFDRIVSKNNINSLNVLTISAQKGLINQEEYFNKSVSSKDTSGYYLLRRGDFSYNKSYSEGFPMGAIKRLNKYDIGVVSPLYICFKIKKKGAPVFFEQYFEAGQLNHEIHKIAQEGARNHGLLNVSVVEFFNDMKVAFPSLKEQNEIAAFLSSLDSKIIQVGNEFSAVKEFKKGLLQRMFV